MWLSKSVATLAVCSLCLSYVPIRADQAVITRHAVIRDSPKSWGYRLGTVEPGERFDLLSKESTNRWYPILYYGDSAWIYSSWIDVIESFTDNTITIASFNTLRLGHGESKELSLVAQILASYDLIALQEVMEEPALIDLVDHLQTKTASSWDYLISPSMGHRPSYQESYAYIWDSDKTQYLQGSAFIWSDSEDEFSREPFVASFRAGTFDFTLMCAHFPYDSYERKSEAQAMAAVFSSIQNSDPNENDVILVGDFNLSSGSPSWHDLKEMPTMNWLLSSPTKTSIGKSGMSKLYDNFWFQGSYLIEFTGNAGTNEFMHEMFEDSKWAHARSYVSDHVPVWAAFRIDLPDDD